MSRFVCKRRAYPSCRFLSQKFSSVDPFLIVHCQEIGQCVLENFEQTEVKSYGQVATIHECFRLVLKLHLHTKLRFITVRSMQSGTYIFAL